MKRSTARWTTAVAAAALIGLPSAGFAQATTPQSPTSQTTPTQTTPSPASTQGQTSASAASATEHVREAKQALSSVPAASIPAASRQKLTQLKTHLNNLERLVANGGQAATSGTAAAKGTAKKGSSANWGTEAAAIDKLVSELTTASTDDTAKQHLMDVRRHVTELASSMSGVSPDQASAAGSTAAETMGASPSATSQSTPTAAAANPTPTTTDPTAAGAANPSSASTPSASPNPSIQTSSAQSTASPSSPAAAGQQPVDTQAAKQHLSEARESLAQLTSLPEAAKLQGDARTQVSQLISNFNELITTQADWKAAYAKVSGNLDLLIGPDTSGAANPSATAGTGSTGMSGTTAAPTGTAGTSGTNAPSMQVDPAIRAKLVEFRSHLQQFEQAAGGVNESANDPSASASSASPSSAMSPAAHPSNPAGTYTSTEPTATGTTGSASSMGTAGTSGSATPSATDDQTRTPSSTTAAEHAGHAEADKHIDAIQDILNKSKDGKLDKAQTDQIKSHLSQLRQLIAQSSK